MILPLIMMAAQAIPAVIKMVKGGEQIKEGKEGLANLQRPEYKMPEEVQRALTLVSQSYADPNMPGQGVMQDQVQMQAANAYKQSSEAGNPFATIAAVQANTNASMQNIGVNAAQYRASEQQRLMQMLQTVGQYRDQEFQMNKFAPYTEKAQEFRDIYGAGQKNQYGGTDQLAGAVGNFGSAMYMSQQATAQQNSQAEQNKAILDILGKYNQGGTGGTSGTSGQNMGYSGSNGWDVTNGSFNSAINNINQPSNEGKWGNW